MPCRHARQRYAFLRARVLPCRMPQRRRARPCAGPAASAGSGSRRAHDPGSAYGSRETACPSGSVGPQNTDRTRCADTSSTNASAYSNARSAVARRACASATFGARSDACSTVIGPVARSARSLCCGESSSARNVGRCECASACAGESRRTGSSWRAAIRRCCAASDRPRGGNARTGRCRCARSAASWCWACAGRRCRREPACCSGGCASFASCELVEPSRRGAWQEPGAGGAFA